MHPVATALRDRPPGARIALVIEGGGMRGAVSGGMVLGLHELGLGGAFDAVFGASAGALNGLWLVADRVERGVATWTDPALVAALIRRRRLVAGRPVVGVTELIERRYERLSPGLFAAAIASRTELHPIATDVATGEAVDLHPAIADERTLRLALRASAGLPLLAGPPVELGGRRLLDAGLSAAIPIRAALAAGATHLLVLRSRRAGEVVAAPGRGGQATARLLRRIDPAVADAFLARAEREGADEALLAEHDADPHRTPHVLSVRPAPGSAAPSRLERDLGVVAAGVEAGRRAVHDALGPAR